ncbi:helix-turn-helix domain-containing protein [Pseudonocardia xishanensis]|uniref:helix-turn-helix domain-containing protein n=1 Tax=Pseudonocardia xishanensis TaxID=630995 RepID=UPI0031E62998
MSDFDDLPILLTVSAAARILGISRAAAYRYVESGVLPSKRLGGRIYIPRDRLRELVETA